LDAIVQINFCLATALSNEYCEREQGEVPKNFLRQANEAIVEFVKTPWASRTKVSTALVRNDIRKLLKGEGVAVNEISYLEHLELCITPPWLAKIRLSAETKCEECGKVGTVRGIERTGIPFYIRDGLLAKFQTLQNVLDYSVHSFNLSN
jgi:hypothetical protein